MLKVLLKTRRTKAKFKEFEQWLKFKLRLKYGWFHLKLFAQLKPVFGGFKMRLKFIEFRHMSLFKNAITVIFQCYFQLQFF